MDYGTLTYRYSFITPAPGSKISDKLSFFARDERLWVRFWLIQLSAARTAATDYDARTIETFNGRGLQRQCWPVAAEITACTVVQAVV